MLKRLFTLIFLITITFTTFCSDTNPQKKISWAHYQLQQMSLEEKIAQLCIIRIHSNFDETYNKKMVSEIETFQPGGVCFFQGGPMRELELTNRIQAVSKIPLIVSMDAEWGVAMRLDSTLAFPRAMTLGALDEKYDSLIFQMGEEIARQCKRLGIHLNYAPVVDVNNNKNNPVINFRSFGEDKEKVVRKSWMYLSGMQSQGVWGCIKHFPGHGDTDVDSHLALPIIRKNKEQLLDLELYPYKKLFANEVNMVMISPLNVPALDNETNSIALISKPIITDLLKNEMGYKGLVITDGMEMEGLRKHFPTDGEAEIRALIAGNDILLLPDQLTIVIPAIKKAIEEGRITEQQINEKCLRVLTMKEKMGIHQNSPLSTHNLYKHLNNYNAKRIIAEIERHALTLLKGEQYLPFNKEQKNCIVLIGDENSKTEYNSLSSLYEIPLFFINKEVTAKNQQEILNKIQEYDNVIVALTNTRQLPKRNYGVTTSSIELIQKLAIQKNTFLAIFGNPYILESFSNITQLKGIIVAYQENYNTITSTIDALYGHIPFEGKLPVSSGTFPVGSGITKPSLPTLTTASFRLPSEIEKEIDSIAQYGIDQKIYPGCQVMALKNGEIIFQKNYGYTHYEKNHPVTDQTLYDMASVTKSLATTLAMMKLYEENRYELHDHISKYLPELKNSNKQNITIAELLTHTSGLPAFISFHQALTLDSNRYEYLNDIYSEEFSIEIAHNLYLKPAYQKRIAERIKNSKLNAKKYVYSDLGFYYLQKIVEQITGESLSEYVENNFYIPMGLEYTCFNPLQHGIDSAQIAPTENDKTFRNQVVQGYVHDQLAALSGGVCGNAGLFSTAEEIAKISVMLMQNGTFGGKRLLKESTVKKFTQTYSIHNCNRRTLGFFTPDFDRESGIIPSQADKTTYGHQGFTGTVFWCDPANQLIFIFLSNRVHPNTEPNNLSKSKIRLILHEKIYEGLNKISKE